VKRYRSMNKDRIQRAQKLESKLSERLGGEIWYNYMRVTKAGSVAGIRHYGQRLSRRDRVLWALARLTAPDVR